MRNEFVEILDAFAKGDMDDVVGLFEFTDWLENNYPVSEQELIQLTCEFVADALDRGFKAGCSPYMEGGFKVWSDQSKQNVFDQIRMEWEQQGKPNLPTAIWFGLPQYQYETEASN